MAAPLFDNYLSPDRPNSGAYDEMFSPDGSIRGPYRALHEAIAPTAAADLKVRSEALDRAYVDQGITFSLSGKERPFPLDIVPRVISAAEWSKLQRGIVQRVQALEMFLADIYGDAEIVRDGVLPRRSDHQLRALPPDRRRARAAQRRAHPRRRDRPRPRRAGGLPGAGGQPAQPVGRVVRDGEPPHDGARLPRPVHPPAGAHGRRLRHPPAACPARRGRAERGRSHRRRAHPRRLQLGLLRALAARPPDGRRAGRGPRPVLPRQPRLHAHHAGRPAGRRDLPADRRRVPRPAAVQSGLGARRRRA